MSREEEPTTRIHVHIFARDNERLQALFKDNLGKSRAIRTIIRKFLDNAEAAAGQSARKLKDIELDTGDKP